MRQVRMARIVCVARESAHRPNLWLLLLLCWCLPHAAAQRTDRYAQGLLWKIEVPGVQPSYIFGTVHLADARVTNIPAPVRDSLNAASSFTMELTFEPANVQQLAGRMFYLDGRNLPQAIGQPLFEKAAAVVGKLGIPPQTLPLMKPWAVTLMLLMPQQDPAGVLDNVLHGLAREQGKTVHQLESVDEQVAVFENMPETDQALMLRYILDQRSRMQDAMRRMVDAYVARDLATLARISDEDEGADMQMKQMNERLKKRALDERNTRMAERMQPQLKAGRAFIAIGALHLYGERSVLALLESRGYRVSRVY
jgi:uncharacterized protein YbaP (TraB family)